MTMYLDRIVMKLGRIQHAHHASDNIPVCRNNHVMDFNLFL